MGLGELQRPIGVQFSKVALEVGQLLKALDPVDLAASVGALLLIPANLHFFFRLEGLAHLALAGTAQGSEMTSSERLRRLCNHTLADRIGHLDDPWELPATVGFTFHGGTRIVIPGGVDTMYELRLLAGVLVGSEELDPTLRESATRLVQAAAALSDIVLTRAGLERNKRVPTQTAKVTIPDSADLRRLKGIVQFENEEFVTVVRRAGASPSDVEPLIAEMGSVKLQPGPWESDHLTYQPLARTGSVIIVTAPHLLMQAAIRQVLVQAIRVGANAQLAVALHGAAVRSVSHSLEAMGLNRSSPVQKTASATQSTLLSNQLWQFDSDKILHLVVVSDALAITSDESSPGTWKTADVPAALSAARTMVENRVAKLDPPVNVLMTLLACVGSGRDYPLVIAASLGSPSALFFLASDLEIIVQSDNDEVDSLLLWKYACARDALARTTQINAWSPLDNYGLWEARERRFLGLDDPTYNFISVQPGTGAEALRWQAIERYDWHAVKHPGGALVEVGRTERRRPIYRPRQPLRDQFELIVACGDKGSVWITSPVLERRDDPYERTLYTHVVRALAFWLSEFQGLLPEHFERLVTHHPATVIFVDLGQADAWQNLRFDGPQPVGPGFSVRTETGGRLTVNVEPAFLSRYTDTGNTAEVELAADAVTQLLALCVDEESARVTVQSVFAKAAPPGPKRMMHQINSQRHPELAVSNRLQSRHLQRHDIALAQANTIRLLQDNLGSVEGSWTGDVTKAALRAAVADHVDAIRRSIRSVDATRALRHLLARNEALLADRSKARRTLPSQLACNAGDPSVVEKLRAELPANAGASLSTRFLVELLASEAPSGGEPMSDALFDELMALAAEIVTLGMACDIQHLQLAEIQVDVRTNGYRIDRGSYGEAAIEVQDAVVAKVVHDASSNDADVDTASWNFPTTDQLNLAATSEFGASISEIARLLAYLSQLCGERGESVIQLSASELVTSLRNELEWQEPKIRRVLELLSLQARESFVNPGPTHSQSDVFPWRFNRELSYLRRPLVKLDQEGEAQYLIGAGAPLASAKHLAELCFEGRLKARSSEMRQVMSQFTHAFGEAFNSQVADAMTTNGYVVRARVKKIGRVRIAVNGNDLGDIDVLAVDRYRKRIWALECKNFAAARVPHEVKADLDDLFVDNDKQLSVQSKHLKRVHWLETHMREILEWLEIPVRGRWSIQGALVFSRALISPLLGRAAMPIWTLHDLETRGGPGLAVQRSSKASRR